MNKQPIIIVAYTLNRIIGINNTIPWILPGDMKHFKNITINHIVIMGRKTWESLKKPLINRINIVISSQKNYIAKGAIVFHSVQDAIEHFHDTNKEIFIIGGESIYRQSLILSKKIIATEIYIEIIGDAYFPKISSLEWNETFREAQSKENNIKYDFVIYTKAK
ncbi:Dihydrofolate reductase [Candidatus Kinetoplastibacterium sorsogonicusi]|uniref:Dihydrofolate reductase n=1 Tax=Candidatus Kinetoplastidibacterium kentomonadis TaxID=1576550 RepID=A0A3Q8F671_9PROT|nr:dihydrofolate reductase [Candidatus Kinetoplastibacterium sorsogonicusi]AWD32232.1 Dihydrofolate reductase [Candidatus Kinetoplastibacterium sorsogonicusi]